MTKNSSKLGVTKLIPLARLLLFYTRLIRYFRRSIIHHSQLLGANVMVSLNTCVCRELDVGPGSLPFVVCYSVGNQANGTISAYKINKL